MKKQTKKIQLSKKTITKLTDISSDIIKGGSSDDTFFDCFSRGCSGNGTGILCYYQV